MSGVLSLVQLACIFFYVGLFAVGGGLVAATFMQQALVERYHLISAEKFYSMLAISESTPGPIGINLATYIGTELYGPFGGIVATVSEVLPAFIIIVLVSRFFAGIQKKPLVQAAFGGVRPATGGLVLVAMLSVCMLSLFDCKAFAASKSLAELFRWKSLAFFAAALLVLFRFKKVHPVFIVLAGALFGILLL